MKEVSWMWLKRLWNCLGLMVCLPPVGAAPRVAVYDLAADGGPGYETKSVEQVLKAQFGWEVELIPDLALERLLRYDVLVLPYGESGKVAGGQIRTTVPSFIEAGGGVLSCFGHVGGGYPPAKEETLFPPVASFAGEYKFFKAKSLVFKPVDAHPLAEGIDELRPSVPPEEMGWLKDSGFLLKRERSGQIVFADPELPYFGAVVAGTYGGGRVVASGLLFGTADAAGTVTIDEKKARLLVNSVKWLAGTPPLVKGGPGRYAAERLAEVQALVNAKTQSLQRRGAALRQAEQEAKRRGAGLAALKEQITKASVLVEGKARAWTASLKSAKAQRKTAAARPSRPAFADLFLTLNALTQQVQAESTEAILAADAATNEVLRTAAGCEAGAGPFPSRALPRFPRLVFHVLEHVRMEEPPSDLVMDKYLREVAEELHANGEVGLVEDVRSPGNWFADEQVMSRYLACCQAHGLQWFAFTTNPLGTNLEKNGALELYARSPAFAGLLIDEPIYLLGTGNYGMKYPDVDEHFRAFLRQNYRAEELQNLLIDPDTLQLSAIQDIALLKDPAAVAINPQLEKIADPQQRGDYQKALWMVAGEFFRDELRRTLEQPIAHLKKVDPDLTAWINLNVFPWYSFGASLPGNSEICDVIGFDPYSSGAMEECVMMEMARGCARGKVWGIAFGGGEYTLNQALYRRHLYNFVLHADGVGVFAWNVMYKHQHGWGSSRPFWAPGFWEMTQEVFRNVEKVEEYLADRQSVAKVALLMSERTMWGRYFVPWGGRGPGIRYFETIIALYAALQQAHVPVDLLFAEKFDHTDPSTSLRTGLAKYAVILCPTAGCLEDSEMAALREWVKAGGVLLATSRTSAYDRFGRERPDYALRDVFHASYQETRSGQDTMKLTAAPLHLSGVDLEYSGNLWEQPNVPGDERDVLKVLPGGTVIGRWSDGSVAAVMGEYGQGACVFTGATFLSLGYDGLGTTHGWPARLRFKPGVREFLDAGINWGLRRRGVDPAVLLDEDLLDLMVDVRSQKTANGKERLVLQFLDYGDAYTLDPAKAPSVPFKSGVPSECYIAHPHRAFTLQVRVPDGWTPTRVKVFNPLTGKALSTKAQGKYVAFEMDPFVLYSIVVLEAKRR